MAKVIDPDTLADPPTEASGENDDRPGKRRDTGRWRRCLASGAVRPESALVRFVADPDGAIVPDVDARLPGRGCWVTADRVSVDKAVKRNLFARSLKQQVRASSGLPDLLGDLLASRALADLGLARRSGALATGFEAVCRRLRDDTALALIEASDGAADGRRKVLALAAGMCPGTPVCGTFSSEELSAALGVANAIHLALLEDRVARRFEATVTRLSGFRAALPGDWVLGDELRSMGVAERDEARP